MITTELRRDPDGPAAAASLGQPAPSERSPRVGLLVALSREAVAARRGLAGGPPAVVLQGAPGRRGAERGVAALCREHGARLVVCLGLAGGLEASLDAGDVVAVEEVQLAGSADREGVAAELLAPMRRMASARLRVGRAVTVDRAVALPEAKRALARSSGALVVDMESYWAVVAGRRLGVPVAPLRAVSDPLDQPLPTWLATLGAEPTPRWGAFARAGLSHPGDLRHLPALWRGARRAERALAASLALLLPALAESVA